jgi:hypothetical protein
MKKRRTGARVRTVSATHAAKTFGRLVEAVRSERAEYLVERSGTPVVKIGPATTSHCTAADLIRIIKTLPNAEEAYLKAVESGIAALNKPSVPENRWES